MNSHECSACGGTGETIDGFHVCPICHGEAFCECCGGSVVECSCEWETRYCMDRIEGGEATSPGYEVEVCRVHS